MPLCSRRKIARRFRFSAQIVCISTPSESTELAHVRCAAASSLIFMHGHDKGVDNRNLGILLVVPPQPLQMWFSLEVHSKVAEKKPLRP